MWGVANDDAHEIHGVHEKQPGAAEQNLVTV